MVQPRYSEHAISTTSCTRPVKEGRVTRNLPSICQPLRTLADQRAHQRPYCCTRAAISRQSVSQTVNDTSSSHDLGLIRCLTLSVKVSKFVYPRNRRETWKHSPVCCQAGRPPRASPPRSPSSGSPARSCPCQAQSALSIFHKTKRSVHSVM